MVHKKILQKLAFVEQFALYLHLLNQMYEFITKNRQKFTAKITKMNKEYSFQSGFDQVAGGKQPAVKAEIMEVLKIKSQPAWFRRLRGVTVPRLDEAKAIEGVFAKFGVTKNIWG